MKPHLPIIAATLSLAGFSGLNAATPVQLQPYLEYAPLQTRVGQTAGTGGMSHAVLVMNLATSNDSRRTPAIVASEYGSNPNSVVAFTGSNGKPIAGWRSGDVRPISGSSGYAYLSGSAEPFPRIVAAFYQKPALILTEYGAVLGEVNQGGYYTSAFAIGGHIPGYRHDFSALYFGGEDFGVHRVPLFTLTEAIGWPKTHTNSGQRVSTPALLDINGDMSPEVFSAGGGGSSGFQIRAHDGATGNLLWARQVASGYAANYLAIGQVRPDSAPEIVVIHRQATSPFAPKMSVWDASTGADDGTLDLPGSIAYGSAPVLADLNGDGLDDVVVATESSLSAIDGAAVQQLPGFPVSLGNVWLGDSAPVIGDLGGLPGAEIVLTTQVPGSNMSQVHILNINGTYMLPRQTMELGPGQTNAIHNLDNDGHNELVIAARGAPTVGLQDSIWVLDFSRNEPSPTVHGAIPWGQFGQNAERCSCSTLALNQSRR